MEQCNDGEWVRFEDYEILSRRLEQANDSWDNAHNEYRINLGDAWREVYKAVESLIFWRVVTVTALMLVVIVFWFC